MATQQDNREGTALITGASSGIGRDYARYLAQQNYNLVITARRAPRLNKLAKELEKAYGTKVTVITADMAKPETPAKLAAEIKKKKITIDYLVNNAGYGMAERFTKSKWKTQQDMVQVMLTGLTELAHIFAADMVKRGNGYIVNIASVAAYLPGTPGNTLYGPIKAYVRSFSQSLYSELRPRGVNVVASCPGYTYTEIHDVAGTRDRMNKMPKFIWLTAPRVVRETHLAVRTGSGPVVIHGAVYSILAAMFSLLPANLITGGKKPTAQKTPAKKAVAKKAVTKKPAAKKAPAKKATAKKAPAKKAPAKRAAKK